MRTRLDAQDRITAILDTAHALMMQHGYGAVSIETIRKATGLSRGGFYHHFASKPQLLEALITRETAKLVGAAEGDLARLFRLGAIHAGAEIGVLASLSQPQDLTLYLGFLETAQDHFLRPLLTGIFAGNPSGIAPEHLCEMLLAVNHRINRNVILGHWSEAQAREFALSALEALGQLAGSTAQLRPVMDAIKEGTT